MAIKLDDSTDQKIGVFRGALQTSTIPTIVRKHLTFGDSHILGYDKYYDLKAEVAEHFKTHPSTTVVVAFVGRAV